MKGTRFKSKEKKPDQQWMDNWISLLLVLNIEDNIYKMYKIKKTKLEN